jgi:hypothetical protein
MIVEKEEQPREARSEVLRLRSQLRLQNGQHRRGEPPAFHEGEQCPHPRVNRPEQGLALQAEGFRRDASVRLHQGSTVREVLYCMLDGVQSVHLGHADVERYAGLSEGAGSVSRRSTEEPTGPPG